MSFRLFTHRLFINGRIIIKNFYKREIHTNILEHGGKKRLTTNPNAEIKRPSQITINQQQLRTSGLLRFGQHARRLFVDNILNRVTTTQSAGLRAEAVKKFAYGDSTPFFALVGVGLASGNGLLTKDDELEGVCWEIREAVSHIQSIWSCEDITKNITEDFGLQNLNIGPPIDKGCAAVVYSASLKKSETQITNQETTTPTQSSRIFNNFSPISHLGNRFNQTFGGSVDNLNYRDFDIQSFRDRLNSANSTSSRTSTRNRFASISEIDINFASPQEGDNSSTAESKESSPMRFQETANEIEYPLALKMMFNYDIQSNAMSILRAMYRETVPARRRTNTEIDTWESILSKQIINLPAHPNIVLMFGVFCAQVPNLLNAHTLYPMALPSRINPDGYGRNMSLFLLMKRYDCSLRNYLDENENLDTRTSILLFAQLLEAAVHMYRYGVSHRDLKADNILIDLNNDSSPVLVLSDFGCCLADKSNGLRLPYPSGDIDKGGNPALMAPEIITKDPGTFSVLNYSKSDLWTCGTIAYEIFGEINPFYNKGLKNTDYTDSELPELPNDVPLIVKKLIGNMLQRNPNNRLSPDIVANVMQLYLWAPSNWLKYGNLPTSTEILQWLLSLTTKVLCEARLVAKSPHAPSTSADPLNFTNGGGRRTYTEYLLISSFLVRARLSRIKRALNWIHDNVLGI